MEEQVCCLVEDITFSQTLVIVAFCRIAYFDEEKTAKQVSKPFFFCNDHLSMSDINVLEHSIEFVVWSTSCSHPMKVCQV